MERMHMFEDTLELAENKLLLLYIIDKINLPISNSQVTDIVLENNFINYFTLQQYLFELISSNFLKTIEDGNKHKLQITSKGKKVLSLFINRVSSEKIVTVDNYLKKQINNIKKDISVISDYTIDYKDKFVVTLKLNKDEINLIDIKFTMDSKDEAKELCEKWKKNSSKMYMEIFKTLLD
ncbi:DUF4364 domain-containing protein [Clostridium tetani]|nr:DUF4364 domain-containing protein [Clostridium tetani]RYU99275.1 DUF4364 domain-containing protein [Clostridium tetani]